MTSLYNKLRARKGIGIGISKKARATYIYPRKLYTIFSVLAWSGSDPSSEPLCMVFPSGPWLAEMGS
jgi:hypothetical protein